MVAFLVVFIEVVKEQPPNVTLEKEVRTGNLI